MIVGLTGVGRDGRASPWLGWRLVLPLVLVLSLVVGCGVTAESEPEQVPSRPLAETAAPSPPQTTTVVQIYLVRDKRLVAVTRTGSTVSSDAIAALAAGPTALDADAGLVSALPPGAIRMADGQDPDVVTVDVSPEFAALSGPDRFLAAAQLVWTATEVCCATQVRVRLDGAPLPLPTDSGEVQGPVRRDDYQSVGPG